MNDPASWDIRKSLVCAAKHLLIPSVAQGYDGQAGLVLRFIKQEEKEKTYGGPPWA